MHTLRAGVRLHWPAAGLQVGPRAPGGVCQGQGLRGGVSPPATALLNSLASVFCKTRASKLMLLALLSVLNKLTLRCSVSGLRPGLLSTLHREGPVPVSRPSCRPG